jgi:outer membrane cobalamin receptor
MSLYSVNVDEVDRIEIVRGASGGWAYGQGGANGVIRIYTRHSTSEIDPNTPPEACGFTFSDRKG